MTGLVEDFERWILNSRYINAAKDLNGGWERWACGEFALRLRVDDSIPVLSEDYCFYEPTKQGNQQQRCDLVIPGNTTATHQDIVELKCFSYNGGSNYIKDWLAPFTKIS